jgi:hypothetical protein
MSLADRLGWATLIVGFFAIAAVYIWPTLKWIGYLAFAVAVLLFVVWGVLEFRSRKAEAIRTAPSVGPPVYPSPKSPGIKVDATVPIASSQMCLGLSDEQQNYCFCPRSLAYELKSLPAPEGKNYATEITITQPRERFQRIRVFLRAPISVANLTEVVPDDKIEKSITNLETMDYDKFSFLISSTAPKISYKVVVLSSEQLRLRCISYQN